MMTDGTDITTAAGEPTGGVSQEVADSINQLAEQIKQREQAAARGRMNTAIVFIVFMAVITGYLSIIFRKVKRDLQPDAVVELAFGAINGALEARGLPPLGGTRLVDEVEKKMKEQVPVFFADHVKPWVDEKLANIERDRPEYKKKLQDLVNEKTASALQYITERLLPNITEALINRASPRIDEAFAEIEKGLQPHVQEVISEHQENLKLFATDESSREAQKAEFTKAFEPAMEEALGPYLDKALVKIKAHLEKAESGMAELLAKGPLSASDRAKIGALEVQIAAVQEGKLTEEDELTIDVIRLISEMFKETDFGEADEKPEEEPESE